MSNSRLGRYTQSSCAQTNVAPRYIPCAVLAFLSSIACAIKRSTHHKTFSQMCGEKDSTKHNCEGTKQQKTREQTHTCRRLPVAAGPTNEPLSLREAKSPQCCRPLYPLHGTCHPATTHSPCSRCKKIQWVRHVCTCGCMSYCLGRSIRTSQNCHGSQMGTTPKRGLKNHFGKLHNCALQGTQRKTCELSKMTVCRGYYMCQSKVMYSFQIWALQCPCKEKSNSSMSSAFAFQTTLQNAT